MSSLTGTGGSMLQGKKARQNMERGGLAGENVPSGFRAGQINNFTPEQSQLFGQQFANVSPDSYTGRLAAGDEDIFNQIEAPGYRNFNEQIGGLASRFSGMGSGGFGSRKSSGFQNAATSAASNFSQDLASRRQDLQRQAIMDLMGMSSQILGQRPNDRFLIQKQQKQNPWGAIAGKAAGAIPGAIVGSMTGGQQGAEEGVNGGFSIFG